MASLSPGSIEFGPGTAIGVRTTAPIPKGRWHQLAATYDASSKAHGLKLFLNGEPLATEVLREGLKKSANVKVDHGGQFVIGNVSEQRDLTAHKSMTYVFTVAT